MRAEFDGQDYFFYLDRNKQELQNLPIQSLEAELQKPFENCGWDKKAILEFGENNGPDGIQLKHLPEGAETWDEFKEIKVTINARALSYVQERGSFGTRYNFSDKIDIVDGLPDQL